MTTDDAADWLVVLAIIIGFNIIILYYIIVFSLIFRNLIKYKEFYYPTNELNIAFKATLVILAVIGRLALISQ